MIETYCDICKEKMPPTKPYGSWYNDIHYSLKVSSSVGYTGNEMNKNICGSCIHIVKDLFKS